MADLITRVLGESAKGSPLSNAEIDQNFLNLNAPLEREALLKQATLSLDFANNKYEVYEGPVNGLTQMPFNAALDFTRASSAIAQTATRNYVTVLTDQQRLVGNREGLLIEEARTNLLSYPRRFDNTSWYKTRLLITPNSAVAPDGTLTAAKANWNGVNSNSERPDPFIGRTESCGAAAGGRTFAASVWLKALNVTDKTLEFNCIVGGVVFSERLVINDDGKWHRYSSVFTVNDDNVSTTISYRFDIGDNTIIESDDYFIWHAQLEEGSFPTSIIPDGTTFTSRASTTTFIDATGTLQTAGVDVARDAAYGYVDGVLKPIGLLLEGAATNLLQYTNFDAAPPSVWTASFSTGAFSYDLVSADFLFTSGQNAIRHQQTSSGRSFLGQTFSVTQNSVYTASVYFDLENSSINSGSETIFSVSGNVTVVGANSSLGRILIDADESGRIEITFIANSSSSVSVRLGIGAFNTATGDVTFTAAQLEEGSYPTSYIPTAGSQVTRAADVSASPQVTRAADNCVRVLGDEFNLLDFTVTGKIEIKEDIYLNRNVLTFLPFSGISERIDIYPNNSSVRFVVGGSPLATYNLGNTPSKIMHYALSRKGRTIIWSVNGVANTFTLTEDFNYVMYSVVLGAEWANRVEKNVQKNFYMLPSALSEAELITLTGGN